MGGLTSCVLVPLTLLRNGRMALQKATLLSKSFFTKKKIAISGETLYLKSPVMLPLSAETPLRRFFGGS